jgi:mono/diheme cytochrome c family protein
MREDSVFKKPLNIVLALVALFLLIQLVPYGRAHSNPPVTAEPQWDSPQTRALFYRACADCHSNESVWPPYASVAPASWLIQRDVDEGRKKFNVSEPFSGGDEAARMVQRGAMPPMQYLPLHPSARLSADEKAQFIQGLIATFGQ